MHQSCRPPRAVQDLEQIPVEGPQRVEALKFFERCAMGTLSFAVLSLAKLWSRLGNAFC